MDTRVALQVGIAAFTLAACGSAPGPRGDAAASAGDGGTVTGGDGGGGDSTAALPVLTPCPQGWEEVDDPELTWCNPWPQTVAIEPDCPEGQDPLPGDTGCFVNGTACPPGGWPEELPPDRHVIYVDQRASTGGANGTLEKPFNTPHQAYAVANDGDVIALATSGLDGPPAAANQLTLDRSIDVTFIGACPDESIIHGPILALGTGTQVVFENLATLASVTVDGADALLRHARVGATEVTAGHVAAEDSVLQSASASGPAARLDLSRSLVRNEYQFKFFLADPTAFAVKATEGARVSLEDSTVMCADPFDPNLGVSPVEGCKLNVGLVNDGGLLIVSRSLIYPDLTNMDGVTQLSEVAFIERGPRMFGGEIKAVKIAARNMLVAGGTAVLSQMVLSEAEQVALEVESGSAVVADLAIREGMAADSGSPAQVPGRGIEVRLGGKLSGDRVHVWHARDVGLYATGEGSQVGLTDLVVADQLPVGCGDSECPSTPTVAVLSREHAAVDVTDFSVARSALAGVLVAEGANMELHSGALRDNPVGAVILSPEFPISRLQDRVLWINNGTNIDTSTIDVPEPAPELICGDGVDNDGNGASDCADASCSEAIDCL